MIAQLCPYIKSTECELYLNFMRGKEVKLTHPVVWSMRYFRGISFFLTSACLDSEASMPLCEVGQQGVLAPCREHWCLPSFQAKLNRSAHGLSPPLAVSRVPQDRATHCRAPVEPDLLENSSHPGPYFIQADLAAFLLTGSMS